MKKELIKNSVLFDSPKFIKQRLINKIIENDIGTYSPKSKPNLIQLKNKSMDEKLTECLDKDPLTIKIIDLIEISKGYKYSVIFEYLNLNIELIKQKCINIDSEYYNHIDQLRELYLEDEKHIFIKFHKEIEILEKSDTPIWHKVRYPILFVFHKKLNMFEIRFDRINTEKDKKYYKIAMDTCLSWLKNNINLEWKNINLDGITRDIVDKYPDVVNELVWAGELAKSQGITLKAGEDMIMPFFGRMKLEINNWRKEYEGKKDALECLDKMESYLDRTKKYANDKFRTLRWLKYKENGKYVILKETIDLTITFNYAGSMIDLINIYDNELNDMERMEYVIELIGEVRIFKKQQ